MIINKIRYYLPNFISSQDRGFISVMAIWIIALLAIITAEFIISVKNEMKVVYDAKSSTQAYYAAEAGFNKALKAIYDGKLDSFYKANQVNSSKKTTEPEMLWRLNSEMPPVQIGDAYCKIWIGNESGRVNVNEAGEKLIGFMFSILGFSQDKADIIRDSILDWRDKDDFFRINGAENNYYGSLKKPYLCKNRNFSTIDEILLVRGMTRNDYYTRFISDIISTTDDSIMVSKKSDIQTYLTLENAETEDGGIQQFLTIQEREKAAKRKEYDYDRININAASPSLLLDLPGMNEKIVSDIIEFRKNADFISPEELSAITGPEIFSVIKDYIHFNKNNFYEIIVDAWALDGSGRQRIKWTAYIENKGNKKKVKILEKIINPDIYAGLEYYDYSNR